MTELTNEASQPRPSKLDRLKNQLELKGLRRPIATEKQQLRKPSSFFRNPAKGSYRGQKSVEDVTRDAANLQLTPTKSSKLGHLENPTVDAVPFDDINLSPEFKQVSNFNSPTRSISSLDELTTLSSKSPTKPITFVLPPTPRISITTDNDSTSEITTEAPSKLSRLKKKTLSMFFDPPVADSSNSTISTKTDGTVRPKFNKSLSDGKQETLADKDIQIASQSSSNLLTQLKPQNDLFRKRSRTLGSVENDLYHKRNTSLVKTIGSMVLLKPKQSDPISASTSDSETASLQRALAPPEIEQHDTPESYVNKLIDDGFENEVTTILSDSDSEFMKACLNHFMEEKFDFEDEALDISLRRFLMVCELPKEAQQIDRVLSSFSFRFYECNKALWENPDQIYFITFSLVMLHTDHFNVNNKKKMSKPEFVKNTKVENSTDKINNAFLSKEILEYFYDNITFTKFIQKNKSSNPAAPLYSLPRRMFSSASSTNLDSVSQLPNSTTINTRSQSISSSTSQFFSSNQMDPYYMIVTDQTGSLKLSDDKLKDENPFVDQLRGVFAESLYEKVHDAYLASSGLYVRFNKGCNWLTGKTEIQFKADTEIEYGSRCLLKIIKIAELYREEVVKNSIFFTIGGTNKVIWKKCFGILTTCGFFIFENINFLAISEREQILKKDVNPEEPIILEILSDAILRSCSKLSINGLFACQSTADDRRSFNIYSTNKKELFSSDTALEASSWITAINYVAALDSCYIDSTPSNNHEVVPIRNITIEEKITKLTKNISISIEKIHGLVRLQRHLNNLVPFSPRTKESLLDYYKSLMIRIDWLWYEVERNQVYIQILQKELQQYDDIGSLRTNDGESLLEDSFINDQVLHNVANQRIPHPTPIKENSSDPEEDTDSSEGDQITDTANDDDDDNNDDDDDDDDDQNEDGDTTIYVDSLESQ